MNPDVFAEWLRRQGHRVIRTASSYWYDQGPRVYQAFPYHWVLNISESELRGLMKEAGAIALRYSAPLSAQEGLASYHATLEASSYDMESLGKWARKNVRRGLKNCTVGEITFERLAEEGYFLQLDTLRRQGRRVAMSEEVWRRRCVAAKDLPGFEAWGAVAEGMLAASVITFQMDDCVYMLYQQCTSNHLTNHVNNALSFSVTQEMIGRSGTHSILYGLHSLDAPPAVDEFKFRMGYTAKPVRQRVVLAKSLRWMATGPGHAVLRAAKRAFPGNPTIGKAEGMIRFCRLGRLPLGEQPLPPPLAEGRAGKLSDE
jgi:hypothetical protein